MRILHLNKFLYRRGGAESYVLDLAQLQRAAGHEVEFFSTDHPANEPSDFRGHFPEYIELNPPPPSALGKAKAAARIVYSRVAERGLDRVLDLHRPDVAHVHNIYHHLSPSVLRPLRRRGIPIVMTLHDFKLACPTHRFLANGRICEACLPRRYYMPTFKRCLDGSIAASTLNGVELAMHRFLGMYAPVHLFACPSRFMVEQMRRGRVYPERLRHVPSFVDASGIDPKPAPGGDVVYAGRLSEEKGVDVLVRAAADVDGTVHVVGDGPERTSLERLAAGLPPGRVVFHGHAPAEEVLRLLRDGAVSVMPSRGYENTPIAILESFACGVPVVGTGHGGIPEMIDPGVDGELVAPGDATGLAATLRSFLADRTRAHRMGVSGRRKAEDRYSPAGHLARLDELYAEAASIAART